jgi:hypothetical protein
MTQGQQEVRRSHIFRLLVAVPAAFEDTGRMIDLANLVLV